ncbi:hypothetical protein [Rhodoferax sp. GW822-FHT02A01]|uniref:hypothetical protein n=1 Tax=Rhodoferax sp. GW822-FHT02A01 TaxID=3141537 RepID=UPI00315CB464
MTQTIDTTLSPIDGIRKTAPACFGAATAFSHESPICTSCGAFSACDDECLVTLELIKVRVDVTAHMKRHMAGRKKLGRSTSVPMPDVSCERPSEPEPTVASAEGEDLKEASAVIAKAKAATVELAPTDVVPTIATSEPVSTPSATVELPTVTATRTSGFPVESIHALPPVDNPRAQLAALTSALAVHGDYYAIRQKFCELSILINLESSIAPEFRPKPKVGEAKGSPIYFEIHRDQLVIDLHWLHTMKERVTVRDESLQHLFYPGGAFPFDLAWSFASEKWKSRHRVDEVLYLTPRLQCQLVTLKGTDVADRLERVMESTKHGSTRIPPKIASVRRQLNEWAERDVRIEKHIPDYEALWKARELLGEGALVKHVAEIFALSTGRTLDVKTVRDKLTTLDKHVTGII